MKPASPISRSVVAKFRAAKQSATVVALALVGVVSETLPYVLDYMPLLGEAGDYELQRTITRIAVLLGIVLRVRRVRPYDGPGGY